MSWQFWIDRGGTFTDCLSRDPTSGEVRFDEPGIERACERRRVRQPGDRAGGSERGGAARDTEALDGEVAEGTAHARFEIEGIGVLLNPVTSA